MVTLHPDVTLEVGSNENDDIACITTLNYIVLTREDGKIHVYSFQGERLRVFEKHTSEVWDMVHIAGNIVVSVDEEGKLYCWDAFTCDIYGRFSGRSTSFRTVCKLDPNLLVLGSISNEVYIVSHENGRNITEIRKHKNVQSCDVSVAYDNIFVTDLLGNTATVWDCASGEMLAELKHDDMVHCTAINGKFIVTGCKDGKLYVRKNNTAYSLVNTMDMTDFLQRTNSMPAPVTSVSDVEIIESNLVMVTLSMGGIFFISLGQASACVARFVPPTTSALRRAYILSDRRIFVPSNARNCSIFTAPPDVKPLIENYAENLKIKAPRLTPAFPDKKESKYQVRRRSDSVLLDESNGGAPGSRMEKSKFQESRRIDHLLFNDADRNPPLPPKMPTNPLLRPISVETPKEAPLLTSNGDSSKLMALNSRSVEEPKEQRPNTLDEDSKDPKEQTELDDGSSDMSADSRSVMEVLNLNSELIGKLQKVEDDLAAQKIKTRNVEAELMAQKLHVAKVEAEFTAKLSVQNIEHLEAESALLAKLEVQDLKAMDAIAKMEDAQEAVANMESKMELQELEALNLATKMDVANSEKHIGILAGKFKTHEMETREVVAKLSEMMDLLQDQLSSTARSRSTRRRELPSTSRPV